MLHLPPKLLAFSQPFAGARFLSILQALHLAKYQISPWFLHRLLFILSVSLLASPLRILEGLLYNKRIQCTQVTHAPLFILGHWRSGTTFLHNLISQDPQWGYISTFQTFFPEAAILGHKILRPVVQATLPDQRPMDAINVHADMPQEEEFALAHMTKPSFYFFLFYLPKLLRSYLNKAKHTKNKEWSGLYDFLIRKFTFIYNGKPLVLKNPPNTARIKQLITLYPQAKFIYIHRDPYEIYFSTLRMLEKMIELVGLQQISRKDLSNNVLKMYPALISRFFAELPDIPHENFISIKYEQLKQNPLEAVEALYDNLKLPGFEVAQPFLKAFVDSQKSYYPARYDMDPEIKQMIDTAWGETIHLHDRLEQYPKIYLK